MKQGVLVLGKQVPLFIGAGIGAGGNGLFGWLIVKAARKILGPPPESWNELREPALAPIQETEASSTFRSASNATTNAPRSSEPAEPPRTEGSTAPSSVQHQRRSQCAVRAPATPLPRPSSRRSRRRTFSSLLHLLVPAHASPNVSFDTAVTGRDRPRGAGRGRSISPAPIIRLRSRPSASYRRFWMRLDPAVGGAPRRHSGRLWVSVKERFEVLGDRHLLGQRASGSSVVSGRDAADEGCGAGMGMRARPVRLRRPLHLPRRPIRQDRLARRSGALSGYGPVGVGAPNHRLSARGNSGSARSPAHAMCPSGRMRMAGGPAISPMIGSSQTPS